MANLQQTMSAMAGRELTLEEAKDFCNDQFGRVATYLREQYEADKCVIYWTAEDIHAVSDDEISEEQCTEILKNLERNFDANAGIDWDTLRAEVEDAGFTTHEAEFDY